MLQPTARLIILLWAQKIEVGSYQGQTLKCHKEATCIIQGKSPLEKTAAKHAEKHVTHIQQYYIGLRVLLTSLQLPALSKYA